MNKKGFTLIELLGVIIILALLATIISPVIIKSIQTAREKAYEAQVTLIEEKAKDWAYENLDQLSETTNVYVSISSLITSGYIEDDEVISPLDETIMSGCVKISFANNKYNFEYNEDICND